MTPSEKASLTFDLMEAGIELYRAGLKTRSPAASEAEIEARVQAWRLRDG
jgi:hypothetical protein